MDLYCGPNKIRQGSLRAAFFAEAKNANGIQGLCGEIRRDRYPTFIAYLYRLRERGSRKSKNEGKPHVGSGVQSCGHAPLVWPAHGSAPNTKGRTFRPGPR